MILVKQIVCMLLSFGTGIVISGAVFAFIVIIGIVPRFAQKTKTENYVRIYENAITAGGIFGASTMFFMHYLPIWEPFAAFLGLCLGIFVGALSVSLAEVLDVVPILVRRAGLKKGLVYFMLAVALGKLAGSLLYYLYPNFYFTI